MYKNNNITTMINRLIRRALTLLEYSLMTTEYILPYTTYSQKNNSIGYYRM